MSWFLLEIDECINRGERSNGSIYHLVIHSMDLLDAKSSNMYIDRIVTFTRHGMQQQGKLIYASDDRITLDLHMKEMFRQNKLITRDDRPSTSAAALLGSADEPVYFLIQYSTAVNDFVHVIIHKDEFIKPHKKLQHKQEVYVRQGESQRLATILYSDSIIKAVEEELVSLKNKCFISGFSELDVDTEVHGKPWLLVQYSCTLRDAIYSIINIDETIWRESNRYPDVVAYIMNDTIVHQCVIIRKSHNRRELDEMLFRIKAQSANAKFPLRPNSPRPPMPVKSVQSKNAEPPIDHQTLCARNPQVDEDSEVGRRGKRSNTGRKTGRTGVSNAP